MRTSRPWSTRASTTAGSAVKSVMSRSISEIEYRCTRLTWPSLTLGDADEQASRTHHQALDLHLRDVAVGHAGGRVHPVALEDRDVTVDLVEDRGPERVHQRVLQAPQHPAGQHHRHARDRGLELHRDRHAVGEHGDVLQVLTGGEDSGRRRGGRP